VETRKRGYHRRATIGEIIGGDRSMAFLDAILFLFIGFNPYAVLAEFVVKITALYGISQKN
jgi:hypothetical protein